MLTPVFIYLLILKPARVTSKKYGFVKYCLVLTWNIHRSNQWLKGRVWFVLFFRRGKKSSAIICHLYELFSLMNQAYESFLPPALLDSCLSYHPSMGHQERPFQAKPMSQGRAGNCDNPLFSFFSLVIIVVQATTIKL